MSIDTIKWQLLQLTLISCRLINIITTHTPPVHRSVSVIEKLSEIEQLREFLDDDQLLFLSDKHMPTSEHTPTRTFVDSNAPQLTEKEIDDFLTMLLRS